MTKLFDHSKYVYPSDHIGEHVDKEGIVLHVGHRQFLSDSVAVDVKTGVGEYTGYWDGPGTPKIGQWAVIRLYNSRGGWYPDDRIVSFGSREMMHGLHGLSKDELKCIQNIRAKDRIYRKNKLTGPTNNNAIKRAVLKLLDKWKEI